MRSLRSVTIALLLTALAAPAAAAGLTDAAVRRFLADQEQAWNARRLDAYFAGFTPDAVFVDQHRTPKELITYGRSTLAEARAFARKTKSKSVERGVIRSVAIAPDGGSARVLGYEVTTIEAGGRTRTVCADTEQTVVLRRGRILSKGQTDTILLRCRPAAR
jgi:hypothetical protein